MLGTMKNIIYKQPTNFLNPSVKYLEPHRWNTVYFLIQKGLPSWEVIGEYDITSEEYFFVLEKLNGRNSY